jgi:hypothetical protein
MKIRTLLLAPLFALMMIALTGCPEDEPTGPDTETTMLSVMINDTMWVADSVIYRVDPLNSSLREIYAWKGVQGNGESISIQIPDTTAQSYALNGTSGALLTYRADQNPGVPFVVDPVQASDGEVEIILSTAEVITGEFSFEGTSQFTSTSFEGVDGTFVVRR